MKKIYLLIGILIFLSACKKDEKSSESMILSMTISESTPEAFTLGPIIIDKRLHQAFAFIDRKLETEDFPISITPEFTLSTGASIVPASNETITFDQEESIVKYVVTAEDGSTTEWSVAARGNQLPNSDFEDWYEELGLNSQPYMEPGKSAESSPWSTANKGTSIYGLYGTEPLEIGDNTLAHIITGETNEVPVAAGTIFTGQFDIQEAINHPDDPEQATDFGTPFPFRPDAIKFEYSYKAGPRYIQCTLIDPNNIFGGFTITDIPGSDEFRVYVIMDIIDGELRTEIGRGELESGNSDVLSEVTIPVNYTSDQNPTHITVMFTPSKGGGEFTGAVGSTFIVDKLELLYE